jgi:hypothetical protein
MKPKDDQPWVVDRSLVDACLARTTIRDAHAVRGLLNRYVLLADTDERGARLMDNAPRTPHHVRHLLVATIRALHTYAELGVIVPETKRQTQELSR